MAGQTKWALWLKYAVSWRQQAKQRGKQESPQATLPTKNVGLMVQKDQTLCFSDLCFDCVHFEFHFTPTSLFVCTQSPNPHLVRLWLLSWQQVRCAAAIERATPEADTKRDLQHRRAKCEHVTPRGEGFETLGWEAVGCSNHIFPVLNHMTNLHTSGTLH